VKYTKLFYLFVFILGNVFGPLSSFAAEINTFREAHDRLYAQITEYKGDPGEALSDQILRQGVVTLSVDGENVSLGQGPGWLFAMKVPARKNPVYMLALVRQDGQVRTRTIKSVPSGFSQTGLSGSNTGQAKPVTNQDEAYAALLNRLLGHTAQGRRIFVAKQKATGSMNIPLWRGQVTLEGGPGWVFFVDDVPQANWEHPCRYVLVSEDGTLHVADTKTPPKDQDGFKELTTWEEPANVLAPDPAKKSSDQENHKFLERVSNPPTDASHRYAVIISGGYDSYNDHVRYWNDCSKFFKALKSNGFLNDHIYTLISNGKSTSRSQDLDGDGVKDIGYSATKANITAVFNELKTKLGNDDVLYIFTTDHGGAANGNPPPYTNSNVVMYLWGEYITDAEFATEVNKVSAKAIVAIFEQCFSGGMIDNLKAPNRVLMSAARFWELSYAMGPDYVYDEFSYYITEALATPALSDSNRDGIVTMEEAYLYALSKDSLQSEDIWTGDAGKENLGEHPSYYSNPWNLGRTISLGGVHSGIADPLYARYTQQEIDDSFSLSGTAQGWHADDQYWEYTLPFSFPYAGKTYTKVYVSSNGIVFLENPSASGTNTVNGLKSTVAIAPLWDDLTTFSADGDDIYVSTNANWVTFAWRAHTHTDVRLVNVGVKLFATGAIRFLYGSGNDHTSLVAQRDKTIGASIGGRTLFSLRNGEGDLGSAKAMELQPRQIETGKSMPAAIFLLLQ
jgi:hypothetical protein